MGSGADGTVDGETVDAGSDLFTCVHLWASAVSALFKLLPSQGAGSAGLEAVMGLLLFKKRFVVAIRSGRKRSTVRRWDRPRVRAGQRVHCPGVGRVIIESIDEIQLADLTRADAKVDGFQSLKDMRQTLRSLYPTRADDTRRWWRICFHCEDLETTAIRIPRSQPRA